MPRRFLPLVLALVLLLPAACTNPTEGAAPDAGDDDDAETTTTWPYCVPGTVSRCLQEGGKLAMICNASGTAFVEATCTGLFGLESMCSDGQCLPCFPHVQACDGDFMVTRCDAAGAAFEPLVACDSDRGQVCLDGMCQSLCEVNFKYNSYIGCDYWGVDLDNAFVQAGMGYYDAAGGQYAIAVANPPHSPVPATVQIDQHEGGAVGPVPHDVYGDPIPRDPLQPGELRLYRLPRRDVNGTRQDPLAYRVSSSAPIIAYQFNPLDDEVVYSNDASLLLPATLLGREYFVMTREQTHTGLRSYLTIVAAAEGTTRVTVDVTAPTQPGWIYEGTARQAPIPRLEPGDSLAFELEHFDVLNLETDGIGSDLTGSRIVADKRIAVFGGSEAANAPNTAACIDVDATTELGVCAANPNVACHDMADCVEANLESCCADHLEQQLFPVSTWGTRYIAAKSWDRGTEPDVWRILAAQDNTEITLSPPQGIAVPTLHRGEYFELESRQHFEITSAPGKPILVGQFLATQQATGQPKDARAGDPAFMLAIPVEQYRHDFVILVPEDFLANYVNIVAPAGAEVRLDGDPLALASAEHVGSGEYSIYRRQLEMPGTYEITSSEPAGVLVYGYDKHVSYGYTGGLDLRDLRGGSGR